MAQSPKSYTEENLAKGARPSELLNDIEGFLRNAGEYAAEVGTVGEAAPEIEVATAGILAFVDVTFLSVIAVAYGFLSLLVWIEELLIGLVSWMPLGIGSRGASFLRQSFAPQINLQNAINNAAISLATGFLGHLKNLFHWGVSTTNLNLSFVGQPPAYQPDLNSVWQAIHQTNANVAELNIQVNRLNAKVFGVNTQVGQVLVPLEQQVHEVQTQLQNLTKTVQFQQTEIEAAQDLLSQVRNDLLNIQGLLHGVRASEAGFSDIQNEIERTIITIEAHQVFQDAELHADTANIAQLAPLGILTEPGVKGIMNLRKLEDDPCQCPKFAGIPNELGTAVSIYEFLTNG